MTRNPALVYSVMISVEKGTGDYGSATRVTRRFIGLEHAAQIARDLHRAGVAWTGVYRESHSAGSPFLFEFGAIPGSCAEHRLVVARQGKDEGAIS